MTAAEQGLLLLCCPLEDGLQPLTAGQYRRLRGLVRAHRREEDGNRPLTAADLSAIGCDAAEQERILRLLDRDAALEQALRRWQRLGIGICTRLSPDYPQALKQRLEDDAPAVLFLLGDRSLLQRPCVGMVGSRELSEAGTAFATAVGRLAARNGLALVSGNARGADRMAQAACLKEGGGVIAFVADRLTKQTPKNGVLYVSEDSPERDFSALRALRRNRLIHGIGICTYVAQVQNGSGGTWSGTARNLQAGWSPVFVHDDGSEGARALLELGGRPLPLEQLIEELRQETK